MKKLLSTMAVLWLLLVVTTSIQAQTIPNSVVWGEKLTHSFFRPCKAENVGLALATARLSKVAGREKRATKITSSGRDGNKRQFFVRPGGGGDGSSWQQAQSNLNAILRNARAGDVIWVAAGTYLPSTTGDRRESFVIPEGVSLFGGFAGYETSLHARNLRDNPTILSGNIGDPTSAADNSYTVVRFQNVTSSTILDGFRIRDGKADGQLEGVHPSTCGGGIFVESASPLIRNCLISNNHALHGGGVYVFARQGSSGPTLLSCAFKDNQAELNGGGLLNDGRKGRCTSTLSNCYFITNQSLYGAAIANQVGSNFLLELNDCHFQRNFADLRDGAILNEAAKSGSGKVVFEACTFEGNASTIGRDADEKPYRAGSGVLVF